jgi:hypothetical protein
MNETVTRSRINRTRTYVMIAVVASSPILQLSMMSMSSTQTRKLVMSLVKRQVARLKPDGCSYTFIVYTRTARAGATRAEQHFLPGVPC